MNFDDFNDFTGSTSSTSSASGEPMSQGGPQRPRYTNGPPPQNDASRARPRPNKPATKTLPMEIRISRNYPVMKIMFPRRMSPTDIPVPSISRVHMLAATSTLSTALLSTYLYLSFIRPTLFPLFAVGWFLVKNSMAPILYPLQAKFGSSIPDMSSVKSVVAQVSKVVACALTYFLVLRHIKPQKKRGDASRQQMQQQQGKEGGGTTRESPLLTNFNYRMLTHPSDLLDLLTSLGLLLIYLGSNLPRIRSRYPTFPQFKALFGTRRPYWPSDGAKTQMYLIGFLLGAVCGYTIVKPIPLMPVWIGVIAGGSGSLVLATGENKLGDLARMMDMKLLFVVGIVKNLEREVFLIRKLMTVTSNVLALLVFWDKYFGIREKVGAVTGFVGNIFAGAYGKVSGDIEGEVETAVGGIKEGMEGLAKVVEML